jgi:hypothetical protein
MNDAHTLRPAIEALQAKLLEQEKAVTKTKELINEICGHAGLPPMFLIATTDAGMASLNADTFYGKALSTAVREYLERRRALSQGPATVNDIHAALVQGGYVFETKDEDNAKRGLRESLSKNTSIFHRLPGGQYGLRIWYPTVREPRADAPPSPLRAKPRARRRHSRAAGGRSASVSSKGPAVVDAAVELLADAGTALHTNEIANRLERRGLTVNRDSLESMLSKFARLRQRNVTRASAPKTFIVKAGHGAQNGATT